jgi:hypothetical protein
MRAISSEAFAVLRPQLSLAGMARSYGGSVQLGEVARRSAVPGANSCCGRVRAVSLLLRVFLPSGPCYVLLAMTRSCLRST